MCHQFYFDHSVFITEFIKIVGLHFINIYLFLICGSGSCVGKVIIVVVIKMVDFLVGSIALLHLVNIVAAAPNLERVVLLVMISLKGRGYNSSAGLSRLRELLQWVRYRNC